MAAKCPVCQSAEAEEFIRRANQPVYQNRLFDEQQAAVSATRGDLVLNACAVCGFIFNSAYDSSLLPYGDDYDNTQELSPFFETHLGRMAQHLIYDRGLRNSRIVEVGCGQGTFLKRLVQDESLGNCGFGFDPSYKGALDELDGRLHFHRKFYSADCAEVRADAVVCRHVIEHVSDPVSMLRSIRQAMSASPGASLFLETPCANWILDNHAIWDLFYEHCSYFTSDSLRWALNEAGLAATDVRHVFEGQYLWVEARVAQDQEPPVIDANDRMLKKAKAFGATEQSTLQVLTNQLEQLRSSVGSVAIWGAGAKGVTMANLLDAKRDKLACVVDLNPRKQGRYLPGTGHAIVDYHDLPRYNVAAAMVMNPNYLDEIRRLLAQARLNIKLICPGT